MKNETSSVRIEDESTRMARLFCDDDDQESGNDTITDRREFVHEDATSLCR